MKKKDKGPSNGIAFKCVERFPKRAQPYLKILRLHDPTLNLMVYWPTAWSIELSTSTRHGPFLYLQAVFFLESFILHGAGLIVNDMFDRSIDRQVDRTKYRPLITDGISLIQAGALLFLTLTLGLGILLQFDKLCVLLLLPCAVCSTAYPISKRFIYFPEIILGISCSFSIPIAWLATKGVLDWRVWSLYFCGVLYWTVSYTIYNSQDKYVDSKIGVKSATLKFGDRTKHWLWRLSGIFVFGLAISGYTCEQSWPFYFFLLIAAVVISHKIYSVNLDDPVSCYEHYSFSSVGITVLLGIMAGNFAK